MSSPRAQTSVDDDQHDDPIARVFDNPRLPSPPAIALQIVEKASQPDCDLDELSALLLLDSGLCGRLLKTVNSGLFGLSYPVSSLKRAVSMLGVRPLRSLVLSLALPAVQVTQRDEVVLKYWRDSVAGAVIARQLAIHLRRPDPEDDLVAGLLRDLGILLLYEAFPEKYRTIWKPATPDWFRRQCEAEQALFGADHAEISACLIGSWNLPPEICLPVRHHHAPGALTDAPKAIQDRAWLLYFAGSIATLSNSTPAVVEELLQLAHRHFGMDRAALTAILESSVPSIREFAALLNVDIGKSTDFAAIFSAGCDELVRLSVETSQQQATLLPTAPHSARGARNEAHGARTTDHSSPSSPATTGPGGAAADQGRLAEFTVACLYESFAGPFRLNEYEVREVIGRGGMGVVFKAYDPMLDRFAAIKMPNPEHLARAEARARFLHEARTSAAVQHENVVSIYAVGEAHGLPYIVMEYVAGMSLEDLLKKNGPLPAADVVRYGRQIAAGLHAAHGRRVIHRDIKPLNVLVVQGSGSVKITDFGLARIMDDAHLTQEGGWTGTPLYMAPEQFSGVNVDHRSDLFSLGSLLYTLCVGKPPFSGNSNLDLMKQVCSATPPAIRLRQPRVPVWLCTLIARLLAKSPAARFQSAADVVKALDQQGT